MTEFDSSWPGWELLTQKDALLERISEPLGGLALVETGVDAHQLIDFVAAHADSAIGETKSEASVYWFHDGPRATSNRGSSGLKTVFPTQVRRANAIHRAAYDILVPLQDALIPEQGFAAGTNSVAIAATRRSQSTRNHTDYDLVTMWLGASEPALQVLNNGEWMPIDDVPVGHALVWRGDVAEAENQKLEPIKHFAAYRSVIRRIVLLA